jgi:hypothetical protein
MTAIDPHIPPHNAGQWQQGGEKDPSPPHFLLLIAGDRA